MAQRGYRRGGAALGAPGREQPAAVAALCSSTKDESVAVRSRKGQPNKRLKLPGVDRSGGIGVLIANLHPLRSEEHTSELQSLRAYVCRVMLENKNQFQFCLSEGGG